VVGVSFWSYQQDIVKFRQSMCQYGELNCRDEKWFAREMSAILKEKFFVFLDSWAKHPLNIQDSAQQKVFRKEAEKLLSIGNTASPFEFRTVNDVLAENHILKKRNAVLEKTIMMTLKIYIISSAKQRLI